MSPAQPPHAVTAGLSAKTLYRRLLQAFEAGEAVDFSVGEPMAWIKAIDQLLVDGQIAAARSGLERVRDAGLELEWSKSVLELVDLLPEAPRREPRFVDELQSDVQVVRRRGSGTVIFAFCGREHRFGMPLWLAQRWMSRLDASIVYLRDFARTHFLGGVRCWASREQTIVSLNWISEQLKADRILCMGNSSGGFAALDYGIALGAEGVLAFSGAMNLEPEFNTFLNRADVAVALRRDFPEAALDLREACLAAAQPPRAILVYGDQNWDDRLQSEHMAGAPGVELSPLEGYPGHGSLPELIRRGEFMAMMADFVAPTARPSGQAPRRGLAQ